MGSLTSTHTCNAGSLLSCLHCIVNYALLDEMTDFGYLQYMEARSLNEFIKTDAYEWKLQRDLLWLTQVLS
ncbi:hypothetical protein YC2023_097988 [Brassica napus]